MRKKALLSLPVFLVITLMPIISQAKELRVAGGAAPMNNIFKPIKEDFEIKTGIYLSLFELGPKIAMEELLRNRVDLACAGLSWKSWDELMKKEANIELKKEDFQIFEVGKDLIKVYVNPSNPVKALTKEQLKGIFTGKIKNWKEVGGKDEPITVVWGSLIPGTNKVFSEQILDGEKITTDVLLVGDANDIKEAVSNLPEAIGIGPMAFKDDPNVKPLETPEIGRPIICVSKGKPTPEVMKLLEFIKHRK